MNNLKKILIVDDSILIHTLLKKICGLGYEFEDASNSIEALTKFNEFKPDLVFLDIIMEKEYAGIEFLEKIKDIPHNSKIVMLTSIADQSKIVTRCVDLGADEYLSKPFKSQEITKVLDTYL